MASCVGKAWTPGAALADRRFLNLDRGCQRLLPVDVLSPLVDGVADDQYNHADGNRAILDGLVLVFLKERDAMFDFKGELIGF